MVDVQDNNEPLVNTKKACPSLVLNKNSISYKELGCFYARETVAKKICRAKTHLPKGVTFKIYDAWRPQQIQKRFFTIYKVRFARKHPKWSKARILKEVKKYVDPYKGKHASAHLTGGAVDITLFKGERRLPMESSKLSFQENAKTFQSKLPPFIRRNRKILISALTRAGLSNNPKEYWHWSYGDIHWAKRKGKKIAIYGIIGKPR
jgi:D-alanyl-D-alanine dipeptidase